MKILGIHDSHNAAAALLVDGVVKSAIQEERLVREKNYDGFPSKSIESVLTQNGLNAKEIDFVAMGGVHQPYPRDRDQRIAEFVGASSAKLKGRVKNIAKRAGGQAIYNVVRKSDRINHVLKSGFSKEQIVFVEHHRSHAYAALAGSPFRNEDVLVLTCDGSGDGVCATVNIYREKTKKLERVAAIPEDASIGIVYAMITTYLGMVPNEHEYKLMGLAPYVGSHISEKTLAVFRSLIRFRPDGLTWERAPGVPNFYTSFGYFREQLLLHRFDVIAAALQKWTEDVLVQWVASAIRATGIRTVALSGGVFMNVKANKAIMEIPELEKMFVFPSCGDETNTMGAAYWVHHHKTGELPKPLDSMYLGTAVTPEGVDRAVRSASGIKVIAKGAEAVSKAAALLHEGQIVARFCSRAEFGARALGNRSILANPERPDVVKTINEAIKSRDFWMPFACSIREEDAETFLINPKGVEAPFMIMTFDTKNAERIAGGIHPYDHTVRPQVVTAAANPGYHALISKFKEVDGKGVVLNTSFNLHGHPIVETAEEAIDVLMKSGLRYLILDEILVEKQ